MKCMVMRANSLQTSTKNEKNNFAELADKSLATIGSCPPKPPPTAPWNIHGSQGAAWLLYHSPHRCRHACEVQYQRPAPAPRQRTMNRPPQNGESAPHRFLSGPLTREP